MRTKRLSIGLFLLVSFLLSFSIIFFIPENISARDQSDDNQWVVWANDLGWVHLGTVTQFKNPKPRRLETWGGNSSDPLVHTKLLGPFPTKEAALAALENSVTEYEKRYKAYAWPKTYYTVKLLGKTYKVGRKIKLNKIPVVRLGKLYLIHITGTSTMDGWVEKDNYILHPKPPDAEGRFQTSDGTGGRFHNKGDLIGGPYESNYELCPILKSLGLESIVLPGGRNILSCKDPRWQAQELSPIPDDDGEEEDGEEERLADEEDNSLYLDLHWLRDITKTAAKALRASKLAKAKTSLQRMAAKKIRIRIGQLQSILKRVYAGDETVFETVLDPFNPVWHDFWNGNPPSGNSAQAATQALQKKVIELRKVYSDIIKDQDKSIANILPTYKNILEELRRVGGRSKHEKIRKAAAALGKEIAWVRDIDRLELPLAVGQSEKVQAVAKEYISQGKYVPLVRYIQALDFKEQGKPRLALQALRLSLESDKNLRTQSDANPQYLLPPKQTALLNKQIQRTEVAYLEDMNSTMMGQAKEIYSKCMASLYQSSETGLYTYDADTPPSAEIGWLQTLKDYMNIGLFSMIGAIRDDTPGGQADLMGEVTWEAAVNHGGLLLITRLRQKGMTLDQIRNLKEDTLVAAFRSHFAEDDKDVIEEAKLTPQDIRRMRQSIMAAFRHPDVERLWAGAASPTDIQKALEELESRHQAGKVNDGEYRQRRAQLEKRLRGGRQQFELDVDRSYFADVERSDSYFHGGAFEYHWLQYMGDVINLKNALFMLGPSTAVTVEGELALSGSATYTAKQLEAAVTVRDIFARLVGLPEVADALYKSPHSARVADTLLRLAEPEGRVAQYASGGGRFFATLVLQMGIVKSSTMLGKAVGGTMDQVLGSEEGTAQGETIGTTIGELAGIVMTSLGAGDVNMAVKALKQARVRHEHMKQLTEALRALCQQADDMAATNGKYMKQLNKAIQEIEGGGMSSGGRQLLENTISEVDDDLGSLVRQISEGKASLDEVQQAYRLSAVKEVCRALKSGKRPAAKWARIMVDEIKEEVSSRLNELKVRADACEAVEGAFQRAGGERSSLGVVRPAQLSVENPALEGSQPLTGMGLDDLADAKLDDLAPRFLKNANRLLMEGKYGEAVQRYKELLTFLKEMGEESHMVGQQLARNLRVARRAWAAHERLSYTSPGVTGGITERFRPGEIEAIAQRTMGENATVNLDPIKKGTYSKPFRVYENNKAIGVFKPGHPAHHGRDLKAELMYYRLAKRLGYKSPACAPASMQTPDGIKHGVFVRFIEGSELQECDAGWRMVARQIMAKDKVLSALLGDHDRHLRNYLVSEKAGIFSIDHGMADYDDFLMRRTFPEWKTRDFMIHRINEARRQNPQMALMERFLCYDDFKQAIREVQSVEGELESLLKPLFDDANELKTVVNHLKARLKLLPGVMEECFGSVAARRVSRNGPVTQPRPLAVLWPCRQWQAVESLPMAA